MKRDYKFKDRMHARFRCDCGAHEIEVCQWRDDPEDRDVYLEFYYSGRNWRTVSGKLSAIWRILRGTTVHQEEVVLTPEQAHEMGAALLAVEGGDGKGAGA